MKIHKGIKIFLIIVLIIIVPIVGVKTYFEIDAAIYEHNIDKINTPPANSIIEHKTISMNGYDVHYFVSGKKNKDAIVFLHPACSDHSAFNQQIDYFSKKHCIITIDLIGHGLSKANESTDKIDASSEHIKKILETEGIDKAHLVGVSMGALIAQYFALNHPDKVKSLTSLGGYNINEKSKVFANAKESINFCLLFRALFSMNAYKKETAKATCNTEKGQALFYKTASLYERKSLMVMPGIPTMIQDRETIQPSYPTLILTGEYEAESTKKMEEDWHSQISDSEFVVLKNAGHCANFDSPKEFNVLVNEFIEKVGRILNYEKN
ncbi:alpha/beta fold hydrolase [Plebeiibacterium sediminum]|uniref:Alpha/beta hydrolase n=1 Tax=Plebeiibacterium sediminum TaxID=2992112 RepID=A0AAE3M9M0_9BACT|nr:alpha/beta hydrolase [Plebeiobacterium sediminum]MCW3789369.1 alpha/beta hydrolase [Plebeiobacterium sediminum]